MKRSNRPILALAACIFAAVMASPALAAGPGDLDTSFAGDGVRIVDYAGLSDTFYGVALHGNAPTACGVTEGRSTITVLTRGGHLDDTFSGDGMWRSDILGHGSSYLEACRYLPDGRLVGVGAAQVNNGGDDRMIVVVRRPNGMPDTHFSGDGLATIAFPGSPSAYAYDLAVQPDGKIVVAGETYDSSISPAPGWFAVARVNPNGALDKTFSGDGRAKFDYHVGDEGVWKVTVQDDGKILLAGWVRNKAGTEWNTGVARLKPNGAPDTNFSGDGRVEYNFLNGSDDYALGLDVRSDERIVLGEYAYGGGAFRARIAQLRPNGGLDGTFGGGDGLLTGFESDLLLEDLTLVGGKIIVGGRTSGGVPKILRLGSAGGPDSSFGTGGSADLTGVNGYVYDFAIDPKGRIVTAGSSLNDGLVFRVLA
jgi:uncharacterized delta-60 repeat protein